MPPASPFSHRLLSMPCAIWSSCIKEAARADRQRAGAARKLDTSHVSDDEGLELAAFQQVAVAPPCVLPLLAMCMSEAVQLPG